MPAVVGDLAGNGTGDGIGLGADVDGALEIAWLERADGGRHVRPARLPERHQIRTRNDRLGELSLTVSAGLFTVGRKEIGPAREHVAVHVTDVGGDARLGR